MKMQGLPARADPKYDHMESRALARTFTGIDILTANMPHDFAKGRTRDAIRAGFDHPKARSLFGFMVERAPDDELAAQAFFSLARAGADGRSKIAWRSAMILVRWSRRYQPGSWPTIRRQLSRPWNEGPRESGEAIGQVLS